MSLQEDLDRGMSLMNDNYNGTGQWAKPKAPVDYTSQLQGTYKSQLGRDADAEGLTFWNSKLNDGVSYGDVSKAIGGSNEKQLETAYQTNFGRHSDAAGLAFFNDKMNKGTSIGDVNTAMINSDEYRNRNAVKPPVAPPVAPPVVPKVVPPVVPTAVTPPTFNLSTVQAAPAQQWAVDPKTQTVAGQLQSILSSDSPLMIQARTRALQQQNASGRLNSTMAQSAGDSAMYDAALQIATPDAQMYGNAAKFNTGEANTFSRDSNQFQRDGAMAQFNVSANDWSAGRTADRAASRDATLNDYATTNAATQNGYQTARDATLHGYSLADVAAGRVTQNERDDKLHGYDVESAKVAASTASDTASKSRLYAARADFTSAVDRIAADGNMGPDARYQAIQSLKVNYNTIIKQAATELGWDADKGGWLIKDDSVALSTAGTSTGTFNTKAEAYASGERDENGRI